DAPRVFALEEDFRILRVIKTVDFTLSMNQCFGIANVRAQVSGQLTRILAQTRKDASICSEDRILAIEDVETSRAVIGINHNLDAVANVVERVVRNLVMRRIRQE